jgi:DNA ligase 1
MTPFANLLDRLVYTPGRTAKLRLLQAYFRSVPDPDRGWALAALTDNLPVALPIRRVLSDLMATRLDPELYRMSREYVGDTAETVALCWPEPTAAPTPPRLADVVERLQTLDRLQAPDQIAAWLDSLDATGRWALLKLLTGGLRVGVSARLAKVALAEMAGQSVDDIESVWHGLTAPYGALFDWLEGRAGPPEIAGAPVFRPLMLAHPLEPADLAELELGNIAAEWKWDGIRVQVAAGRGEARLYSRTGDDIGRSFPDLIAGFRFEAVVDGELLVVRDGVVAPFNDLQQRLNRKVVSVRLQQQYPAHIRLYDVLEIAGEDLRGKPWSARRARLETWHATEAPPRTDLSPLIHAQSRAELGEIWQSTRGIGIEGMMLKRRDSHYVPGRPKGHWWKWKRSALTADCVLLYAQRGSGKRASFYSDYTFGCWRVSDAGVRELVPVGKAYSGFTDAELKTIDAWVRAHTIDRFGPVRRVAAGLVFEVAFDAVQRSARHKSGVAMRFPRIARIRWDKPIDEADTVEILVQLIET